VKLSAVSFQQSAKRILFLGMHPDRLARTI
jgi:hypothetical protein